MTAYSHNGLVLVDFNAPVLIEAYLDDLCLEKASGTLSADSNPVLATNGQVGFSKLRYDQIETIHLKASSPGILDACSNPIRIQLP